MLVILGVLAAAAQAPATTTQPAQEADPIICTGRGVSEVGTHMKPKKVCMRKSDWDYQERHTRNQLQQINQRGNNPGNSSQDRPGGD